ncbi:MAG TPA: lysoplasmalogenase [Dermatophilaceae bacterium]|nr:lysoplasmalogenase [Dermatophilaceae bacterium]
MSTILWALVALASALASWYAVDRGLTWLERVVRPATMLSLILVAVSLGAWSVLGGRALVIGLVFGLVGDVALLDWVRWPLPRDRMCLIGVGAFLAGHLAYLTAFISWGLAPVPALAGMVMAGGLAVTAGRRVHRGAVRAGGSALGQLVAGYLAVLVLLAGAAGGTAKTSAIGAALLVVGVLLFTISNAVLGLDRFVAHRPRGRLVVMVTYHLAQGLLVAGSLG